MEHSIILEGSVTRCHFTVKENFVRKTLVISGVELLVNIASFETGNLMDPIVIFTIQTCTVILCY